MLPDKEHNFRTPKGYFEGLDERLKARLAQEMDASEEAIPKTDGFGVPQGYFGTLEDTIMEKLDGAQPKVVQLTIHKRYYYVAASLAALFSLFFIMRQDTVEQVGFEDLASADIEHYFEQNELGLSSYEMAEGMDLNELTLADITENGPGNTNVLDYLDEHVDELDELNLNYDELDQ
ncbi:MAG: hypothetical protein AB3N16_15635 [Flavobacteriaceae bacterium]